MKNQILETLSSATEPRSTVEIADTIKAPRRAVLQAINELLLQGVLYVERRDPETGLPRFRQAQIGNCEWCGLFDHHLVEGECPRCRFKVLRYPARAQATERTA